MERADKRQTYPSYELGVEGVQHVEVQRLGLGGGQIAKDDRHHHLVGTLGLHSCLVDLDEGRG